MRRREPATSHRFLKHHRLLRLAPIWVGISSHPRSFALVSTPIRNSDFPGQLVNLNKKPFCLSPLPVPLLQAPDLKTQRQMTLAYQESLRSSPGWDAMVQKYGLERAEELLQQCRVEFR